MNNGISYGVIFDMDGVLIDSADAHYQSWKQLAREIGADVTQDQFDATFGRHNSDIIPIVFDVNEPEKVKQLADRKEELYRDLVCRDAPIVDGAIDLVRSLYQKGIPLAVGSSAPRANIKLILTLMGVQDCFSALVSADEVTRGKPDPQVFSKACEKLNLPPAQCVVIEDAPAGIEAASTAGTKCVAILMHHPRENFAQADLVVEKLSDLSVDKIEKLISN